MPQEPKKRHSRARQGKRRHSIRLAGVKSVVCANCKAPVLAHIVCKKCGYYNNKKILTINKTTVRKVKHDHNEDSK